MDNPHFDYVALINMDKSKDRWESSFRQINKHKLKGGRLISAIVGTEFCPWGDALELEPNNKRRLKYMRELMISDGSMIPSKYNLNCGEIGVIMSLIGTFKKAIELNFNKILIVEDDFKLPFDFCRKLDFCMTEAPEDADVLYLGFSPLNKKYGDFEELLDNNYWERPLGISNEHYLKKYKVAGGFCGGYGMIVNKKAMLKFIEYAYPVSYPSDTIMGRLAQAKLINAYSLKKPLISYFRMGSTIGYR